MSGYAPTTDSVTVTVADALDITNPTATSTPPYVGPASGSSFTFSGTYFTSNTLTATNFSFTPEQPGPLQR